MADDSVPSIVTQADLSFKSLAIHNRSRAARWHEGADPWSGADWSNAMCGEAGEAANVVKKMRRIETGTKGAGKQKPYEEQRRKLAAELADIVIYVDLLAHHYEIELSRAIVDKFNEVSESYDFPERLRLF